ncbi:HK97 family phage prohead protease [Actinospongicola halichondriae]|uniref:HK97 family phage prohead protease n=1 Tax=Actinospongicola halichondriae TaxID=3236844 RepID=UPI003D502B48
MPDTAIYECRTELDNNTLIGHAAVYDTVVRLGNGTYEAIAPGAFDGALADTETDVRALIDHNSSLLLGRQSTGTLRLSTDEKGLVFEVDLPNTGYANDLRELIERGDVTGASFGFRPGQWDMESRSGNSVRVHTAVAGLRDVSPVTFPAYPQTDVSLTREQHTINATTMAIRIRQSHMKGRI